YIDGLLGASAPGVPSSSSSSLVPPPRDGGGDDGATEVIPPVAPDAVVVAAPATTATTTTATTTTTTPGGDDVSARVPRTETFDVAIQCCAEDDLVPVPLVSEDDDDGEDEDDGKGEIGNEDVVAQQTTSTTAEGGAPPHSSSSSSSSSDPAAAATSPSKSMSADERSRVLSSGAFAHFLSDAGRRVERLLGAGDDDVRGILTPGRQFDFGVDHADEDSDDDYVDDVDEVVDGVSSGLSPGRRRRRRSRRGRGRGADGGATEAYRAGGHFVGRATYELPAFTRGRDVTDVEWCPGHGEWMVASYGAPAPSSSSSSSSGVVVDGGTRDPTTRGLSPNDTPSSSLRGATAAIASPRRPASSSATPDGGIVAIYNLSMPNRPEHLFCAGCPILRCRFHPTEGPRLVVGGGSSGQVLVWDARAGRYPVQRSGGGHDREIVGMRVLGGDGGAGGGGSISSSMMVTASSDGGVNYWSASNLREPVERVAIDANLSCLEVLHGVAEGVACGDERGGLHAVLPGAGRDGTGSNRRVVRTLHPGGASTGGSESGGAVAVEDGAAAAEGPSETGHYGVVTGIAARNVVPALRTPRGGATTTPSAASSRGFSRGLAGLVVTTGVDWSTKLWAPAHRDRPLTSFLSNSYDYIPVHPSIFATASSNGTINIWNLASTLDQPVSGTEGIPIDGSAIGDPSSSSCRGLNRIQWSSDGRRLAVASGDKLHVLGVGEHVWKAKGDEEGRGLSLPLLHRDRLIPCRVVIGVEYGG
ncbi:hypothetical protein ACHAW5_000197, partial [Stephanodiscus triporus]